MASKETVHVPLSEEDKFWNGPRFVALLCGTVAVALAVIYFIACVKSGNYVWNPLAHDPATELMPAND